MLVVNHPHCDLLTLNASQVNKEVERMSSGTEGYWFLAVAIPLLLALITISLRIVWPTQYMVFRHNFSEITDYGLFDNRLLSPSPNPLPLREAPEHSQRSVN